MKRFTTADKLDVSRLDSKPIYNILKWYGFNTKFLDDKGVDNLKPQYEKFVKQYVYNFHKYWYNGRMDFLPLNKDSVRTVTLLAYYLMHYWFNRFDYVYPAYLTTRQVIDDKMGNLRDWHREYSPIDLLNLSKFVVLTEVGEEPATFKKLIKDVMQKRLENQKATIVISLDIPSYGDASRIYNRYGEYFKEWAEESRQ